MSVPVKTTYTILDPDMMYHTVVHWNSKWFGMDNIVASIDDPDIKWYTIRKLQQQMLVEVEGKWGGFEWIPID